ncbi:hypothetical protein, partial [Klebsiella pneumoniae]|uniref:hypothetical protein n=1 Tax=Klebsiella pneumoniae TaxID=573 RepID=UPI003EE09949
DRTFDVVQHIAPDFADSPIRRRTHFVIDKELSFSNERLFKRRPVGKERCQRVDLVEHVKVVFGGPKRPLPRRKRSPWVVELAIG